jgi:hypothetical protein
VSVYHVALARPCTVRWRSGRSSASRGDTRGRCPGRPRRTTTTRRTAAFRACASTACAPLSPVRPTSGVARSPPAAGGVLIRDRVAGPTGRARPCSVCGCGLASCGRAPCGEYLRHNRQNHGPRVEARSWPMSWPLGPHTGARHRSRLFIAWLRVGRSCRSSRESDVIPACKTRSYLCQVRCQVILYIQCLKRASCTSCALALNRRPCQQV